MKNLRHEGTINQSLVSAFANLSLADKLVLLSKVTPENKKHLLIDPSENPKIMFADLPDVMTCKEASSALSICEKTLRELAIRGEVKGFKVGKVWRFTRKSLTDFIEDGSYGKEN